jgi:oligoribonuclease NrnB/cAMP/cGMP phosphodiesterase (DHH superfamily)
MSIDILVSHNDLDGIGATFIGREVFPDIDYVPSSYKDCEVNLHNALDEDPDLLIITDVWPGAGASDDLMRRLRSFKGHLLIFDHHRGKTKEQQESLIEVGATVWNTPDMCATALIARFFGIDLPVVDLINTYDLSGTLEGQAGKLNVLFWEKSHREIRKVMARNPFYFTETEESLLSDIEAERHTYFLGREVTNHIFNGHSVAFVEANDHLNYVSKQLLKTVENVILFNGDSKTISIRSNSPFALPIAERLGGGGHPQASGVSRFADHSEVIAACQEVFA